MGLLRRFPNLILKDLIITLKNVSSSRKRPIKPSTSGDAAAIAKRKMEMQQRAQGIRMKYIDKLATVLNADQVSRFFEVESIIQKKLKEKHDQASSH